ncbi:hypothetical protein FRC04_002885 [Tulasnella sp. 424]|nr:hypothetical protein FRC04_002885 [Tulasnella sp. 424]
MEIQPRILRLGTKFNKEDTDLFTFIKRHASSEVYFILARYLPSETTDKLREKLLEAGLLAVPGSDESEEQEEEEDAREESEAEEDAAEESEAEDDASEEDTRVEPNGR